MHQDFLFQEIEGRGLNEMKILIEDKRISSMLKNLMCQEIDSNLQSRGITTHVKTFPGTTTDDKKLYIKRALKLSLKI